MRRRVAFVLAAPVCLIDCALDAGRGPPAEPAALSEIRATSAASSPRPRLLSATTRGGCLVRSDRVRCWSRDASSDPPVLRWHAPLTLPGRPLSVDGDLEFGCALVESPRALTSTGRRAASIAGFVYCWGDNSFGQLGAGTPALRSLVPLRVLGSSEVERVAVGREHACALNVDGTVACWGRNASGECGSEVDYAPELRDRVVPKLVPGVTAAERVAVGDATSCAILSQRTYCWGELGSDAWGEPRAVTTARTRPQELEKLSSVAELELEGGCGCALFSSGKLACFTTGLYGCPSRDPRAHVDALPLAGKARKLSVGAGGACVETLDGKLHCWSHEAAFFESPSSAGRDWNVAYRAHAESLAPLEHVSHFDVGAGLCSWQLDTLRCWDSLGDAGSAAAPVELPLE